MPMPPFQPNATVPVPAPTEPSSTVPSFADSDRGEDLVAPYVTAPNVVQVAVVRLGDDRVDRTDLLVAGKLEHPLDQRVGDAGDVQGVGQQDRRLDLAKLVDLSRTHQFAEAVAHEYGRRDFFLK